MVFGDLYGLFVCMAEGFLVKPDFLSVWSSSIRFYLVLSLMSSSRRQAIADQRRENSNPRFTARQDSHSSGPGWFWEPIFKVVEDGVRPRF